MGFVMFLSAFGAGFLTFGLTLGVIVGIFMALRNTLTKAEKEHNDMALAWKAKTKQVLAKAKLTLRSSKDLDEVMRVTQMLDLQ